MPYSATERFARTYTPRVPDDSYDSLGDPATIVDWLVQAPFEKPFELCSLTSGFTLGAIWQAIIPTGQITRINMNNAFASGALLTQAAPAPVQFDGSQIAAAFGGGSLH